MKIPRPFLVLLLLALWLGALGCASKDTAKITGAPSADSIGVAWLEPDGTLMMQLRAESQGKAIGDALLRYKPDDPRYRQMLDHVGPIKPGERKPVPPWPAEGAPKSP